MTDDAAADTLEARLLSDRAKRPRILDDCVKLIEAEVDSKGGLSGLAIKGGYKIVCSIKPGFVREAMDHLLDDFVRRLEPFYAQHQAAQSASSGAPSPKAFGDLLSRKAADVADALLGITDDRARRAKNPTLKSAYERLRPQGKKHVEEAVPRVGRTLAAHL
jgi:hypothetical protein